MSNLLAVLAFKDLKIFLVESDIQAFVVIADRHRYQYQVDIHLDGAVVGDERRSNLSWRFRRIDVNLVNQALGATSRRRYRTKQKQQSTKGSDSRKPTCFAHRASRILTKRHTMEIPPNEEILNPAANVVVE